MAVVYLGMAWLVGIWSASLVEQPLAAWLLASVGSLAVAAVIMRQRALARALVLASASFLGGARAVLALPSIDPSHVAFYNGFQDVTLTGLVAEEPVVLDTYVNLVLDELAIMLDDVDSKEVSGRVLVRSPRFLPLEYGARIEVTGLLTEPPIWESFNYRQHLARQGVYSTLASSELLVLAEGQGSGLRRALIHFKQQAHATINQLFPEPQASLLTGILLGDDSGMERELAEAFRTTGMSHVIAISGFNIAVMAGVLLALGRPLFGGRWNAWFALLGVAVYAMLVGGGASVLRSAIMGSLYIIALHMMGRATFGPAGLFTAGIVMTMSDPNLLWDAGLQLSFMATLGLMLYVRPWSQWVEQHLQSRLSTHLARQITRILTEILFTTLAASLLSLPVSALHFGRLPLIGLAANLFVLPVQAGVMVWGGLATLTGMLAPMIGQVFAWVAWLFLSWTIWMVRFFSVIPGATTPVSVSPSGVLAAYLIIFSLTWGARWIHANRSTWLAEIWQRLPEKAAVIAVGIAAALAVSWAVSQPDGKLHVLFFDVGNGDATFIQTPSGRQILVDGGLYPSRLDQALGKQMPFWDREIDIIFATHPDADHVSGLPGVFERYRVGRVITNGQGPGESTAYDQLLLAAKASGSDIHVASSGETILIGDGVLIEVLNPAEGANLEDRNEDSVCLRLVYGDFTLLLTGDAEEGAERQMVESGRPLSAVVIKAGHHGSRSSSKDFFLEAVQPQIFVVSAGEENRFGHPHPEALRRAADVGAVVLRTDELGTIEVISDGESMWWQSDGSKIRE